MHILIHLNGMSMIILGHAKEKTPKQRLLNWIQGKVPDRPIKNFNTDWNDGYYCSTCTI